MSAYSAIDLSRLPAPAVVEQVDYEVILQDLRDYISATLPELAGVLALESEPINLVLEAIAYRETVWRADGNDSARAVMLPFAAGTDLDNLGALLNVARQVVTPADPEASPPVLEVLESDARFRSRIQLAPEAYTVAGSSGAYRYHALSAHAEVADVDVYAPKIADEYNGAVEVTILSSVGDGTPSGTVLSAVQAALTAETVRPLTDRVYVQAATIVDYAVTAELYTYEGPDSAVVLAAAEDAVTAVVAELRKLGHDITRSRLFAALHVDGVQRVELTSPGADLAIAHDEAANCTAITLTYGGVAL